MNLRRLWQLVKGELLRLHKYNVFSISLLIAFMWGVILYFLDMDIFSSVLPLILIVDATMMSIMYIGSVMFFEKTESTISTLLVTPSTNSELVLSKVLANTVHNMFSALLIIIAFVIIKNISPNYVLLAIGIILATAFHTTLGVFMAYYQKNFTGMLVNIMVLAFALMVPSILYQLKVITASWFEYVLLINPIQAATELINAGFDNYVFTWKYYFSLGYMLIGLILIYRFLVLPKFKSYAVKQSGV